MPFSRVFRWLRSQMQPVRRTVSPARRLLLECLEDRTCPTISTLLSNGNLLISGSPPVAADTLLVQETAPQQITITDNGIASAPIGGITGNITLQLSGLAMTVTVDTDGNTDLGNVTIMMANAGSNIINVLDSNGGGGLTGNLFIDTTGTGAQTVTFGNGTSSFSVAGTTQIVSASTGSNAVTLSDLVTLKSNLTGSNVTGLTLDGGATVTGQVVISSSADANPATVSLDSTSDVTSNVQLSLGSGGDTVTLDGTVGGNVGVATAGTGTNLVTLDGAAITGYATFNLGNGSNTLTAEGSATVGSLFSYTGGSGSNTVNLNDDTSAVSYASLSINLGSGVGVVTFGSSGTVTGNLTIIGGAGNDSVTINSPVTGNLTASVSTGTDSLTDTGSVGGNLAYIAVSGTSTVDLSGASYGLITASLGNASGATTNQFTLADGAAAVSVTVIGGSGKDTVLIDGTVTKNLTATLGGGTNSATVGAAGDVEGSFYYSGTGADSTDVAGAIGGTFSSTLGSAGPDAATLAITGTVGAAMAVYASGASSSTVDIEGSVGSTLTLVLGNGTNVTTIGTTSAASVGGTFSYVGGSGHDTVTIVGSGGVSAAFGGSQYISLGAGTNSYEDGATMSAANVTITSGAGTDSVTFDASATFGSIATHNSRLIVVLGGSGDTVTFHSFAGLFLVDLYGGTGNANQAISTVPIPATVTTLIVSHFTPNYIQG